MITIVRFTNTKTIYTVVTDCHSRVIANILVNPAPCMNPHHLLRWLVRRLACGTAKACVWYLWVRSSALARRRQDVFKQRWSAAHPCKGTSRTRPPASTARGTRGWSRSWTWCSNIDDHDSDDQNIRIKKLWGWIASTTSMFWPLSVQLNLAHFSSFLVPSFHLFLFHLSICTWSSCHRRHDQSSGRQDEVDLPSTHRRRRLLHLSGECQYSIPQRKRKVTIVYFVIPHWIYGLHKECLPNLIMGRY